MPQTDGAAGVFLAVDAEPDGTVDAQALLARQFPVRAEPALGGPGFKRFRPIMRDKNGALRRLTNDEIAKNPQYGDFSLDQSKLSAEDFYDRMDDVMSPVAARSLARHEGGDHLDRRASEDARRRRSRTAESS